MGIVSIDKLIKPAAWIIGLGAGGFLLYKFYQGSETRDSQRELDNSPEAQQANTLLSILHPYSYKGLQLDPFGSFDVLRDKTANIDEQAAINVAFGIQDLDKVSKFYKGLTGGRLNLPDDLRNMLNTKEQSKFFDAININKNRKSETKKKPFDLYIAPQDGTSLVAVYEDSNFKKPLFKYKKGTLMGKALKLITVPLRMPDGSITSTKLYYLNSIVGKTKGQNIYVLASQVSSKKPR